MTHRTPAVLARQFRSAHLDPGLMSLLGASRQRMLALVIREGITLVALGTMVGIVAALAMTRLATSLLFGIAPTDVVSFLAAVLCLTGVAFLASYLPARRATRVDPVVALRYE